MKEKITLSNGFKVEVDKDVVKTYRFSKIIAACSSKDNGVKLNATFQVLPTLIGDDVEEELLEFLKKQNGKEPTVEEVSEIITEIFEKMKDGDEEVKKS